MQTNSLNIRLLLLIACLLLAAGPLMAQKGKKKNNKQSQHTLQKEEMDAATRFRVDNLFVEACTQMIRGDLRAAADNFEQVLALDPTNHAAMYNIGKLAKEQHEYERAISYARAALDLDPSNYWYYKLLEEIYEQQGNHSRSLEVQSALLRKFPQNLDDHLHLVTLYERAGNYDEAIAHLEEITRTFGPKERVERRKYQLYIHLNQHEKALEATRALIRLNPAAQQYYQWQYEALQSLGRTSEAAQSLKQLLQAEPNNGFALLELAQYYRSQGDMATSDEYLFRAFKNPEIDVSKKLEIARGLLRQADGSPEYEQRMNQLSQALLLAHPDQGEVLSLQAEVFLLNGQPDSAKVYFRRSLQLDPGQIAIWEGMLEGSYRLGHFRQMKEDAEEALEFFPNQLSFLFYFGLGNSRAGSQDAAVYAFEKIRKIGTDEHIAARATAALAFLNSKKSNLQKTEEEFQKALSLHPDDDFIQFTYAQSLAESGEKLDLAQKVMHKIIENQPDVPLYQATYGWILFRLGKLQQASQWLEKAARKSRSPQILEQYGDVLFKMGDQEKAKLQWQKAIEAGAEQLDIQQKLQNQ
ncbi:MAG: hypothetical protein D6730_21420 [Bacteroidetes bacterium]|nr:MAG: hypothetical protein D6730_21420 [Bacteroidota bacterium]